MQFQKNDENILQYPLFFEQFLFISFILNSYSLEIALLMFKDSEKLFLILISYLQSLHLSYILF